MPIQWMANILASNDKPISARLGAVKVLQAVNNQATSLSQALPAVSTKIQDNERPLCQELSYGVLRWQIRLEAILSKLLKKAFKKKDSDLHYLLLTGLYQLLHSKKPDYAILNDCVESTRRLKKAWASGLTNASLRRFIRETDKICQAADASPNIHDSHPIWLFDAISNDWPDDCQNIFNANNIRPPMTLRVNLRHTTRDDYRTQLDAAGIYSTIDAVSPAGICLMTPVNVLELPGFTEGAVSVQDAAAQLAAPLLAPKKGERILDTCAAPGGKTIHLLEVEPEIAELVAIDIDPARLQKVQENLDRCQPSNKVKLVAADASDPSSWWDGIPFDKILLDAPCSALGVIRRHPDIKCLRRQQDITALVKQQANLLKSSWPLLAKGGYLLYATCSILKVENERQVNHFIDRNSDANIVNIDAEWGSAVSVGRQILAGESNMDGFYFALIQKLGD